MCQDFEDDTTSSSRIFVKIMMQEMMEGMDLKLLVERFKNPEVNRERERDRGYEQWQH
jgi:hypothetical protein